MVRRNSLRESRVLRYLLYAAGEILLIIVGILLALEVSNRNEQQQREVRLKSYFEVVMDDLTADIQECRRKLGVLSERDSLTFLVLNDKLTAEDYLDPAQQELYDFFEFFSYFKFTQSGYENLLGSVEHMPENYRVIFDELTELYNTRKVSLEYWDDEHARLVRRDQDYNIDNHPWYYNRRQNPEAVDYYLNGPRFRNLLVRMREDAGAESWHLREYLKMAIGIREHIAEVLDKEVDPGSTGFGRLTAALQESNWRMLPNELVPGYVEDLAFKEEEGRLICYSTPRDTTLLPHTEDCVLIDVDLVDGSKDGRIFLNQFFYVVVQRDTLRFKANDVTWDYVPIPE